MRHEINLHSLTWCQCQGRFPLRTGKHEEVVSLEGCSRAKMPEIFQWRYLPRIHFTSQYTPLISRLLCKVIYYSGIWCAKEQKRTIAEGKEAEERRNLGRKEDRENAGCNLKG